MSITTKFLNTLALVMFMTITRAYLTYLYGKLCGINLFNWNTWGNIIILDSPFCNALEWSMYHSKTFTVITFTGMWTYFMGYLQKELKENTI